MPVATEVTFYLWYVGLQFNLCILLNKIPFLVTQELFEGYYFCQAQSEEYFSWSHPREGHPTILR